MTEQSKSPALYGALYVDQGELLKDALEQITGLRDLVVQNDQQPLAFVFDVVHETRAEAQSPRARRITTEIEAAIHEAFGATDTNMVVVVISSAAARGDRTRPGRDLVIAMNNDPKRAAELLREYVEQSE